MGNGKIKIGIAGCGWIAENAHIPAFARIANVEIASVFDSNMERAAELAGKYGIPLLYGDFTEFLASGMDAIIIATPNYTHAEYSLKALKAGKHVLCEKPVSLNTQQAKAVMETAGKENRLFIPGFVNRFREDIQKVIEVISAGEIGRIRRIEAGWVRKAGLPRPGTWFMNRELSGGGVLVDLGSHVVDICLMFLGDNNNPSGKMSLSTWQTPEKILESSALWFQTGETSKLPVDVEDTARAVVEFDGGAALELELSWSTPVDGDYTYFYIYGTQGELKLKTLFGFSNQRLWKKDSLVITGSGSNTASICFNLNTNNTGNAFCKMAQYFIHCVTNLKPGFLTAENGVRTVGLIECLYGCERKKN